MTANNNEGAATSTNKSTRTQEEIDRFREFAHSYVSTLNVELAAIRAGYDESQAYSIGTALMQVGEVKEFIRRRRERIKANEEACKNSVGPIYIIKKLKEITDDPETPPAAKVQAIKLLGSISGMWEKDEKISMGPILKLIAGIPGVKKELEDQEEKTKVDDQPELPLAEPAVIPMKRIVINKDQV